MNSYLIYTIDDDHDFNMLLKMALKPYEIELKTHETVDAFTASFKKQKPDLCILDLNLNKTGGEGFQLIKAIRNVIGLHLPIWSMSRRGGAEDVQKALSAGANDFIPKPLDDHFLALKLGQLFPEHPDFKNLEVEIVKVEPVNEQAVITISFSIIEVSLDFILLKSEAMVGKNQNIQLKGDCLQEIFNKNHLLVKVLETQQDPEDNYLIKVQRNYSKEEYLNLRKWLFSNLGESL